MVALTAMYSPDRNRPDNWILSQDMERPVSQDVSGNDALHFKGSLSKYIVRGEPSNIHILIISFRSTELALC